MDKDFVLITVNEEDQTFDLESNLPYDTVVSALLKVVELMLDKADEILKNVKEGVDDL